MIAFDESFEPRLSDGFFPAGRLSLKKSFTVSKSKGLYNVVEDCVLSFACTALKVTSFIIFIQSAAASCVQLSNLLKLSLFRSLKSSFLHPILALATRGRLYMRQLENI